MRPAALFYGLRTAQAVVVVLLLISTAFVAVRLLPGGPAVLLLNPEFLSPGAIAQVEQNLGLDQPLPVQYLRFVGGVIHGDLGWSYQLRQPVAQVIGDRLVPTLLLMTSTFLLAIAGGLALGFAAAVLRNKPFGRLVSLLPVAAVTVPAFWFGLLVIYGFAINWPLLPSNGMLTPGEEFELADLLRHVILPAITLALAWIGSFALFFRSSLLTVLQSDYLRTARAKGLRERSLLFVHALPNAALPVITLAGLSIPHLFANSVVVERIFGWPGVGRLLIESLYRRDYPVILGIVLLVGVLVVTSSLATDLTYRFCNPVVQTE